MKPEDTERMLKDKADQVRHRLLDVVDELDRRRHEFSHPKEVIAQRLPAPYWIAAAGAAAVTVVALVGAAVARRNRTRRKVLWIRRAPPPPSFGGDVLSRAGRALVSFALIQLGKAALTRTGLAVR